MCVLHSFIGPALALTEVPGHEPPYFVDVPSALGPGEWLRSPSGALRFLAAVTPDGHRVERIDGERRVPTTLTIPEGASLGWAAETARGAMLVSFNRVVDGGYEDDGEWVENEAQQGELWCASSSTAAPVLVAQPDTFDGAAVSVFAGDAVVWQAGEDARVFDAELQPVGVIPLAQAIASRHLLIGRGPGHPRIHWIVTIDGACVRVLAALRNAPLTWHADDDGSLFAFQDQRRLILTLDGGADAIEALPAIPFDALVAELQRLGEA